MRPNEVAIFGSLLSSGVINQGESFFSGVFASLGLFVSGIGRGDDSLAYAGMVVDTNNSRIKILDIC